MPGTAIPAIISIGPSTNVGGCHPMMATKRPSRAPSVIGVRKGDVTTAENDSRFPMLSWSSTKNAAGETTIIWNNITLATAEASPRAYTAIGIPRLPAFTYPAHMVAIGVSPRDSAQTYRENAIAMTAATAKLATATVRPEDNTATASTPAKTSNCKAGLATKNTSRESISWLSAPTIFRWATTNPTAITMAMTPNPSSTPSIRAEGTPTDRTARRKR